MNRVVTKKTKRNEEAESGTPKKKKGKLKWMVLVAVVLVFLSTIGQTNKGQDAARTVADNIRDELGFNESSEESSEAAGEESTESVIAETAEEESVESVTAETTEEEFVESVTAETTEEEFVESVTAESTVIETTEKSAAEVPEAVVETSIAAAEVPEAQDETATSEASLAQVMQYVVNTNTGKFHHPNCRAVKQMKTENRLDYEGSREDLIAQGYEACGICKP